ncbi:MAG: PEGA domain-containing protein [bacterium]|nr:PEGA domain-containing protein [bacterium]
MMKQLLSLASILFVLVCVGAILVQFTPVEFLWDSLTDAFGGVGRMFNNEGALEIASNPDGAAVYLDNKFVGETPLNTTLAKGNYDVKVVLSGFQTYARHIAIEKNDTAVMHARLSKEYGALHITSSPSQATVYIDGKRQGQLTPFELQVSPGKYAIRVEKDNFYFYDDEVTVEQANTMTVEADLVRQVGRIVLETVPPGAKAYIGNDLIGTTPFTHDKPVGKYVITLKKQGFRDKIIETSIAPDETLDVAIDLNERVGALKVTTNPPGAEVHVNDAYQGETPIRIEKKPGEYRLVLRKKKFRDLSEELVIEDNITKNIHRDLDPVIVEIRIESEPSHARIWLNGEDMGYTPVKLNKEPGSYAIRLTKPGFRNYVDDIRVQEGAFIQLKPVLEKEN